MSKAWNLREDAEYPFELSVPVADAARDFRFRTEITGTDGKIVTTPETLLAAPR